MPLTKAQKLERLTQRSVPAGRQPIDQLQLEPLPKEIVKAFPAMMEWHRKQNAKLKEFTDKMNTVIPT